MNKTIGSTFKPVIIPLLLFAGFYFIFQNTLAAQCMDVRFFSESFDESNGATSGTEAENSIGWSMTCPNCAPGDIWEVDGGEIRCNDCGGTNPGTFETAVFESDLINIPANNESITLDLEYLGSTTSFECLCECDNPQQPCGSCSPADVSDSERRNCWDFLRVSYALDPADPGNPTFTEWAFVEGDGSSPDGNFNSSVSNINVGLSISAAAHTFILKIEVINWAGSEEIFIDNINLDYCQLLPHTLTDFSIEKRENTAHITWETGQELNNDYFAIQHSKDGIVFKQVGTVPGNGTTQEKQNYTFVHTNPTIGNNYYRLKQVDFNENYYYSGIKSVYFDEAQLNQPFFITPNPTRNFIHLLNNHFNDLGREIKIFDAKGRIAKQILVEESFYRLPINVSDLSPGHYYIILNDAKVKPVRFIKY